jgi:hypothetical protein
MSYMATTTYTMVVKLATTSFSLLALSPPRHLKNLT